MKERVTEARTCPKCGRTYTERPALSRSDNNTLICPDCGTREALETTTKMLNDIRARKITYSIKVPETDEEMLLAIWDCGYAESGSADEILSHTERTEE